MRRTRMAFSTVLIASSIVCATVSDSQTQAQQPPVVQPDNPDEPVTNADANPANQPPATDENRLPQLQSTPPTPPRQPNVAPGTPDFLRGIQLADAGPRRGRQSYQSLLSPAQFHGNVFGNAARISGVNVGFNQVFSSDLPLAGGNSAFSIADNNKPLPQNRVFFDYRYYNNAVMSQVSGGGGPSANSRRNFDSFMFGVEKTLGEAETASIEVRIPFFGDAGSDPFGMGIGGDQFGNIPLVLKQSLFMDEFHSIVAGTALITPTGGDVSGVFFDTPFRAENEAWHLAPFVGAMFVPDPRSVSGEFDSMLPSSFAGALGRTTFQFFGQIDNPLNDQEIIIPGGPSAGFREATIASLSGAAVYNFFDRPNSGTLTRLDGSVELHYTKNIGGGDSFSLPRFSGPPISFSQSVIDNVLNMTAGLSFEVANNTRIQAAAAVPLSSSDADFRRAFDSEFIVSINRFY